MLSYNNGIPIATIKDQDGDIKILKYDENVNDNEISDKQLKTLIENIYIPKFLSRKRLESDLVKKILIAFKTGECIGDQCEYIYNKIKDDLKNNIGKHIEFTNGETILPLPYENKNNRIFIAGPSESGKSYLAGNITKQWSKIYPDRKIFLFSPVSEDPALDPIKNLKRVELNEEIVNEPINTEELKDSLVIFDDIYGIQDKKIKQAVYSLKDSLLQNGRHNNIDVISIAHTANDNKNTKADNLENNQLCIFLNIGSHFLTYMLREYLGYDRNQIKMLKAVRGRYIYILRNYRPNIILTQDSVFILPTKNE